MPTVSIALATCNGSRFIAAQLDSLIKQTRRPDELVVSDDCSDDNTIAQIQQIWCETDIPIKILRNVSRLGYAENFIQAAMSCSSDLIAFCDQDDVWSTEKLEKIEKVFADPDILMVHHNAWLVDSEGGRLGALDQSISASDVITTAPMSGNPWLYSLGFTQIFRRQLLTLSPLHDFTRNLFSGPAVLGHDYWISFLSSSLGKVVYMGEKLADYRQHSSNTFGASAPQTKKSLAFLERIMALEVPSFEILLRFCRTYAVVLQETAGMTSLPKALRSRAEKSYLRFLALAELYEDRREIYRGANLLLRARAFCRLIARGGYSRANPWSFSFKSACRDGLVGVVFGRISQRRGRSLPWSDWSLSSNAPIPLT